MKRYLWHRSGAALVLGAGMVLGLIAAEVVRVPAGTAGETARGAGTAAKPAPQSSAKAKAKAAAEPVRFGSVVGLRREKVDEYRQLHANTWPAILEGIRKAHIQNYSIYLAKMDDGNYYLFAYYEYVGENFERDMAELGKDPIMQAWWRLTDPCQFKLKNQDPEDRWMPLEEVFRTKGAMRE